MASGQSCERDNKAIDEQVSKDIETFHNETQGAVAKLLGYPTKIPQKKIAKQIAEARSRKDTRTERVLRAKLAKEIAKYNKHNELFDMMVDYIMQSGKILNYEMNPVDEADAWNIYLSTRGWGEVNGITIQQSPRAIFSIAKRVKAIMDKRNKLLKKGKLNKREVGLFKPEIIGITADRFGIVTKVIRKALRVTEDEINSYADYSAKFTQATSDFRNLLEELAVKTIGRVPIFSLKNGASLWGIDGFKTIAGEKVLIIGEKEINGYDSYLIKRWDDTVEDWKPHNKDTDFIRKEEIKGDKFDIQKALIKQYTDHFFNEVLDGQSRYVNLSIIPRKWLRDENNVLYINPQFEDFKKKWLYEDYTNEKGEPATDLLPLQRLMNDINTNKEFNKDNDGNRITPGLHKSFSKDGRYAYTYVLLYDKQQSLEQGRKVFRAFIISKYDTLVVDEKTGDKGKLVEGYLDTKRRTEDGENKYDSDNDGYDMELWNDLFDENGMQMQDGWMRSTEEFNFGRYLDQNNEPIKNTNRKAYINFNMIEQQPPEEIFNYKPVEPRVPYNTFWDAISKYDSIYQEVGSDIQQMNHDNLSKIKKFRNQLVARLTKKGKTAEEIDNYIKDILSIGGMRSKVFSRTVFGATDPRTGDQEILGTELMTPSSYFRLKTNSYFPHMFDDITLLEMAQAEIAKMKDSVTDVEDKYGRDSDEHKDAKKALEFLTALKDNLVGKISDNDKGGIKSMVEGESNIHFKHITAWTDASKKRTDNGVHHEYLKKIYSNLHRNSLSSDLLAAVDKLVGLEGRFVPEGTIDYLTNRVKMAVGDSDTRSTSFITGREGGYGKVASFLNRVMPKKNGNHTAESSERLVKWVTAFPTMRYLGTSTAIGNLTQIVNQIIANGMSTFWKAQRVMNEKNSKWDSIVEKTGVLNIMSMFTDIMLQGGDVEWNDYGLFAGGAFGPIPGRNMVAWWKQLSKGRESFIKGKDKELEEYLMKIEYRNKGLIKEKIKDTQELARRKRELNKKRGEILERQKGVMFDLLTYKPKSAKDRQDMEGFKATSEEIEDVEHLLRKHMGNISDMKLKQMASWKLSWHLDITKGMRNFLTFSGTETNLRKLTAIMALLDAEKKGLLGGDIETRGSEGDGSIFTSPLAVKIARDAVYQTQFGMTPAYVGEGFNGIGRAIWQYKIYPVSQMEHDYNVMRRLWEGSDIPGESIIRLGKALFVGKKSAIARAVTKTGYDPADKDLDHEAIAASRLILSRFSASVVASIISVIPIMSMFLRMQGSMGFSLLRSAENPAMGLTARTLMWMSLIMMGADDDDNDRRLNELLQNMSFLILPLWISMLGRDAMLTSEWMENTL